MGPADVMPRMLERLSHVPPGRPMSSPSTAVPRPTALAFVIATTPPQPAGGDATGGTAPRTGPVRPAPAHPPRTGAMSGHLAKLAAGPLAWTQGLWRPPLARPAPESGPAGALGRAVSDDRVRPLQGTGSWPATTPLRQRDAAAPLERRPRLTKPVRSARLTCVNRGAPRRQLRSDQAPVDLRERPPLLAPATGWSVARALHRRS